MDAKTLRALRGATTVDEDSREQVVQRTAELIGEMMARNGIDRADMISVIFTATGDIRSEFPAAGARSIGISDVPLLCARELEVQGAVPLCIRILMHLWTALQPDRMRHVYLHGAEPLRTDLPR